LGTIDRLHVIANSGSMERRFESIMDDQLKVRTAAEARLKDEIIAARTELRDLVRVTKDELERADAAQAAGAMDCISYVIGSRGFCISCFVL
jgi:2-methylisocitrate lyase-like PEP mutase family enzyme